MANIWDDESVSDYELIAEDAEKAEELAEEYASKPTIAEAEEEVLEEIAEESAFRLDRQDANVVYNARLRLEQAKLYEMLINHNLFEGVDSSKEAIFSVQNELKFYIVKRLEILLGIREPVVKIQNATAELPFNDVEIDFLKQLAYKGTLGASATTAKAESPQIKPLNNAHNAANKLKAFANIKPASAPKKQENPVKELRENYNNRREDTVKKAAASQPVAKKQIKPKIKIRESGLGRELTAQEAELIAKEELAKNPPQKPFHELSAKEKAARVKEVNERHKRPVPTKGVAPMPSANELEMKYMNQQTNRSMSRNQTDQFNTMLANALAVRKNQGDQDE